MDGTRGNRSDLTIDGVPSTATANAGEVIASYVPPADIVQEFKVQTATFDASFGNTEGGVTNLSIKSGTNRFSGTAYFVKTPAKLFANDFFANANNIPLPDFSYNRYGGTAGGPVVLPGYDGRQQDVLHVRLRGHPRGAAAQQRHADGADARRCAPATSRSCWRSGRSIRSTTRSRGARSAAAGSSRIRSRATSFRRA